MDGGIVYLVGAGPGDPDLITVAGLKCLRRAEVVVYDRLVNKVLLAEAPMSAERIYVGKGPGCHSLSQDAINDLLIARAKAGQVVVRLKGGDPFVFGRGGEEAAACAAAGVRWEVVPGLSSALAVPARVGIPMTQRGVSRSFAVVAASHAGDDENGGVEWAALAKVDTLVILMAVERLSSTVSLLMQHGRAADTPVAIIQRGTWPDEQALFGSLAGIVEQATQAAIEPPAVMVVGEVVRWRERALALAELMVSV